MKDKILKLEINLVNGDFLTMKNVKIKTDGNIFYFFDENGDLKYIIPRERINYLESRY